MPLLYTFWGIREITTAHLLEKRILTQTWHPTRTHCLPRTHDLALYKNTYLKNIWCTKVPIIFLYLLLLKTSLWPKTEDSLYLACCICLRRPDFMSFEIRLLRSCQHLDHQSLCVQIPLFKVMRVPPRAVWGYSQRRFLCMFE